MTEQPKEEVAMKPPPAAKTSITPPIAKNKTQIARRLTEAVNKAPKTNRSADLVPLQHGYNTLRNRLRSLTAALRAHQAALSNLDKCQMEVVKEVTELSSQSEKASPINTFVCGAMAGSKTKSPESYVGVHEALSKNTHKEIRKYQDNIIDYVVEWERIVTARFEEENTERQRLNGVLNHYQTKVEGLRKDVNKKLDKGLSSPSRKTEKLSRNEDKLKIAWEEHEHSASRLCDLLQEATESGWKDLYPLVIAMMKFDSEKSADEREILSKMDEVEALVESSVEAGLNEAPAPPPPAVGVDTSSEEGSVSGEEEKPASEESQAESTETPTDEAKADTAKKAEEAASPSHVAEFEKEGAGDDAPPMPKVEV